MPLLFTLGLLQCSNPVAGSSPGDGDGTGSKPGDGDGDFDLGDLGGDGDLNIDLRDEPAPETCGDGVLDEEEACDDGNRVSGDGCYENCRVVEPGFICPQPGEPCRPFAKCGDGRVNFPEQCDDGNTMPSDGCSAICKLEIGYKCDGVPSICSETTCGDGEVEGAEGCDDGNPLPFDGCDGRCQWEPSCGLPGSTAGCTSFCGDGILLGEEECDDGNTISGDGCSEDCEVEEGYTCNTAPCDEINGQCVLKVPAVYRDFLDSHANFQVGGGSHTTGLVLDELSEDGKPVWSGVNVASMYESDNVNSWYVDGDAHSTILSELVLFENGAGGFVNRFLPDGTPYENANGALIDGTPLFFPIDDFQTCSGDSQHGCTLDDTRHYATIPGEPNTYETGGWIPETPAIQHNFSFTTHVSYWFEYDAENPPTLDFLGDDDVWVFVNGKLAIDLGGPHVPLAESLTLDNATNTSLDLGLATGNIYPISVFHAERNPTGSSFRLTLSGFRAVRSTCLPNCGDGIIQAGEECDDGVNDGGHNECQPGCVLATYCGDGIVQASEECDDNAPDAPPNCSGCRLIVVR